ncbi:MAG: ATPase domain-containing protein [Candidatus Altiarchaeota archaeon]
MVKEKLNTGIRELDELLGGGIPRGHVVLLSGSCGTGKTILSHQFLFEGAKKGESGLYISLTEPSGMIEENLEEFSFYDKKYVDEGLVNIIDVEEECILGNLSERTPEYLVKTISDVINNKNRRRIVLDSVTALADDIEDEAMLRDFLLSLRRKLMKERSTLILISEIKPMTFEYSKYGVEEFVSDGVIMLSELERKGDLIRTLQVIKMRGIDHSRNKQVMKIMKEGIVLNPIFKSDLD